MENAIIKAGRSLVEAYRFFRAHAGQSAVAAIALARAEQAAERKSYTFKWEYDEIGWDSEGPTPSEVLVCVCYDPAGRAVASLGGIGDPDRAYVRLVEAELALEAGADCEPCEPSGDLSRATGQACDLKSGAYTRTDARCFRR